MFATRLQASQSAQETIDLFRCEKNHHEKQVFSFGFLQGSGAEIDTLVTAGCNN